MRDHHSRPDAFADAAMPTLAGSVGALLLLAAVAAGLWAVSEPAAGALLFLASAALVSALRHR